MNGSKVSVTIDLELLALRLKNKGKKFIKIDELAYELATTPRSAGRILVSLAKLGYVSRWSSRVYLVHGEKL
ncbi:MAG: hypothetical protein QXM54_04100 [Desulfurococcaceae archaeon]|uniref:HTH iclR-type domain-containing protein n=1 Tax=Staphylothermus marinus TaxID=2280 RepID=A0A7C4JLD5_STAMA